VSLRDIVRVSFGASLPLLLYKAGRKGGQQEPLFNDYPFFKRALRQKLAKLTPDNDDPRPMASYRPLVQEIASSLCSLFPIG
jgi:hypothetical protein